MNYTLDFSKQAQNDIASYKESGNKAILKKLAVLFEELTEHPFEGTGKPEPLKYELSGLWSRRITRGHRLVYQVCDDSVWIHSAKEHYL
jgi:toxin YoeB